MRERSLHRGIMEVKEKLVLSSVTTHTPARQGKCWEWRPPSAYQSEREPGIRVRMLMPTAGSLGARKGGELFTPALLLMMYRERAARRVVCEVSSTYYRRRILPRLLFCKKCASILQRLATGVAKRPGGFCKAGTAGNGRRPPTRNG